MVPCARLDTSLALLIVSTSSHRLPTKKAKAVSVLSVISLAASVMLFSLLPRVVSASEISPDIRQASLTQAIENVSRSAAIVNRNAPLSVVEQGPVTIGKITVVLNEQTTYVYSADYQLIATFPVSTGLYNSTPTGSFKVFSRSAQTYYSVNPQERMRWMTRFTVGRNGGNIGFHSIPYANTDAGEVKFPTPIGLAPSSHGCIRMRDEDAEWLFNNIKNGTVVEVVKSQ
jgi:lipoprotein-anchoring transpeptidase ErfK/SrfK